MLEAKINKLVIKIILKTAFVLMLSINIFAQNQSEAYKYAEYERPGSGCDEYFRVTDFLQRIEVENAKGLIVIYSGDNRERFGSVLAYTSGAKRFLTEWMGLPSDKVSFVIVEGKNLFNEEFWVIPQNAKSPEIKQANFEWTRLENKYFFSESCAICEPSYRLLTTFQPGYQEFAKILTDNPNYKGLITVGSSFALGEIGRSLTKDYKLSRNRFAIQMIKSKKEEENLTERFYIVPKINTVSKKYSKNDRISKNR